MHSNNFQKELAAIYAAMDAKVFNVTSPTLFFSHGDSPRLSIYYAPVEYASQTHKHFRNEDVSQLFADALAFVAEIPTEAERREVDLRLDLADLIDKANHYNMPLDFVNPLTESMKRLSSNILTFEEPESEAPF